MRLRVILMVISLLAFMSASTGGVLYYSSLKKAAFREAERRSVSRVETIKKNLSSFLSENIRPVRLLAGARELVQALQQGDADSIRQAHAILDRFQADLDVAVCYLLDAEGTTIASSNRNDPDSFVGKNFAFRPYYQKAMENTPATYLALGSASNRRGAYYSFPVFTGNKPAPEGVAVIKASIEQMEKELGLLEDEQVFVTDPRGIIFISNRREWLYHFLWKVAVEQIDHAALKRQFGSRIGPWTGLEAVDATHAFDGDGNQYLMQRADLENYAGWEVIRLKSWKVITRSLSAPLFQIAGPITLSLCVLVGLAVFVLYRKASQEIFRRKKIQSALRASEERYRSLYQQTPAMLHSIDAQGRLVNASDYWVAKLGYASRREVIGKKLTDFFTQASRKFAENQVFPEFFRTGQCKDVPYQYICRDGETIDVLLSAIAVEDEVESMRSLAVSIDVTERNRAEAALKETKDALSRQAVELERQVKQRTKEITDILTYTPDVVYIKDTRGRYQLINPCFEKILGQSVDAVRGGTDFDILPREVADQFRESDARVLEKGDSVQVEEFMPHRDGSVHTYLAVKFPIFNDKGTVHAVCSIATDITELKKAQNQLRRLSAGIINSQEKERTAIARELHDELGQVLTALKMDSVWLEQRLTAVDEKAAGRALTMRRLIDTTIQEVRSLAIRLRPGVLDDLGLVEALEWYTGDFERRAGITCIFEHEPIPAIGNTLATAAYRIAQEALTNVARHSRADHARVGLAVDGDHLLLEVYDNGQGFDPGAVSDSEGLGLAGMRERAGLADGALKVTAGREQGTRISFRAPLENRFS